MRNLSLTKFSTLIFFAFLFQEDCVDQIEKINKEKKSNSEIKQIFVMQITFWVIVLFIVIFSCIYLLSRSTVFTVSAQLEQVSISPVKGLKYPYWSFKNVIVHPDCGEENVSDSGVLYPDSNAYIDFLRVQNRELTINMETDLSDSVGDFISKTGETLTLDDCAVIRINIKDDDSLVFPIEGDIKLGGEIKEGTNNIPILYNGKVSIVDKELLTRNYYSVGPFELEMGDVFIVSKPDFSSSGFVHVDKENGLKAVYNSKGEKGYIKRYKTENIDINNGFWTKIYNDPSLVIVWFSGMILYVLLKVGVRYKLNKISN